MDEIGDQIVEPAVLADQADQRLARHGFLGGEDSGFDPQHPFPPARGRRQVGELDVEAFVSAPLAAAGGGAHRPYSRNAGRPENSRAAPSATSRSNRRRAARPVIGAWRAASAGETQSWASRRSTIFWAGLARSLGATAIRVSERRERSAARSRAEAAANAIAPAAAFGQAGSPGLGRRPALGRPQGGVQNFHSDQRHGPRPAQPDRDGEVEQPKGEDFGFGRWGVREGGERQGGGLGGRRDRIALPCASLQAVREAVRVRQARSSRAAASASRPGSRLGGRLARSRHSDRRFAAGPSRVANGEAQVAQRAFVGVEAQDLGGGGGALSARRERSAPAAGGSRRRTASSRARPAPAKNRGSPSPALPLARAQRRDAAGGGKAVRFRAFAEVRLARRAGAAAQERPRRGRRGGREQGRVGANHVAMVNLLRRFVSSFVASIRPACRLDGDVR